MLKNAIEYFNGSRLEADHSVIHKYNLMAVAALEKQQSKNIRQEYSLRLFRNRYFCPNCDEELGKYHRRYCDNCGQKLQH